MTPAIKLLNKLQISHQVRKYRADDQHRHFGEHAANALDQNPDQVFKTLITIVDGKTKTPVVALVAVSDQLDLKKLASEAGGRKAVMADTEVAQRCSGYLIGGISPLGQKQQYKTLIDTRAVDFPTIFISGGKRGLQLELSPTDLVAILNAKITALAR